MALKERIEEIMDRVQQADDNQVERVAALGEYLTWRAPTKATRSARSATRPAVATPRAPRCCAS